MAEIIYKKGNLVEAEEHIIVHGVNAQGKMNSGVAKAVRDAFPSAYDTYRIVHEQYGLTLGDVIWDSDVGKMKIVGNAVTQEFYGYDGKKYADYDAIRTCIKKVSHFIKNEIPINEDFKDIDGIKNVAFPKIAAGLGGGDWEIISKIIEEESGTTFQPIVYEMV